jgi:hypothetical protein
MTQQVPGSAPAGPYSYFAYIGDEEMGIVWSFDNFVFSKQDGDDGISGTWECLERIEDLPTIETAREVTEYVLYPTAPNPFNPETVISYHLPANSFTNLSVYDMQGRKVAELVHGWRDAGRHEAVFDGSGLASGVYIYRLSAGDFSATGKMILMK